MSTAAAPSRALPPLRLRLQGALEGDAMPARSTLRRWVQRALEREAELAVVFADRASARRLNRDYRSRDYATNVLTFSYATRPVVSADIVLCVPVLRAEARAGGRSLRAHLAHLLVHGVLHAQGYDHETGEGPARRMQARERAILASLGFPDPYA